MKKSTTKIPIPLKTIKVIPYGWTMLLFDDRELFNQYVSATLPAEMHQEYRVKSEGGPRGRTLTNTTSAVAVVGLFKNDAGECSAPGTIAHELLHVVLTIFEHIGLPVTEEVSEASCYLIGYLMDEVWPAIARNYDITLRSTGAT